MPRLSDDGDVRSRAVALRLRLEAGRGHHRELRREAWQVLRRRDDEEIADEEVLPRELVDEADRQAVARIGAGVEILHEQLALGEMGQDIRFEGRELLRVDRLVHVSPGHVAFARRLAHDELVVRRSARVRAGLAHDRPVGRQLSLAAADGVLVQWWGRKVPVNFTGRVQALLLESVRSPRVNGRHVSGPDAGRPACVAEVPRRPAPGIRDRTGWIPAKSIHQTDLCPACYNSGKRPAAPRNRCQDDRSKPPPATLGRTADATATPASTLASEIKALVVAGDRDAARDRFGALVALLQRRGLRIAYHYLRDAADADEAVQDAFVKVFLHIEQYREDLSFDVWFMRILVNACLDRLKSRTRQQRWMASPIDDAHEARPLEQAAAPSPPASIS